MPGAEGALCAALGRAGARLRTVARMSPHVEVAVVGGGLAGSLAASKLAERVSVSLFDMGRAGFGAYSATFQLFKMMHK